MASGDAAPAVALVRRAPPGARFNALAVVAMVATFAICTRSGRLETVPWRSKGLLADEVSLLTTLATLFALWWSLPRIVLPRGAPKLDHVRAPLAPTSPDGVRLRLLGRLNGTPWLAHWSLPLCAAAFALVAGTDLNSALMALAAFAAVPLAHVGGLVGAARGQGLKVHGIVLTSDGGRILVEGVPQARGAALVRAAGLIAQAMLLAAALAWVAIVGAPDTAARIAVVSVLTWVNAIVLVANLLPGSIQVLGAPSTGQALWDLHRHVRHGAPRPPSMQAAPVASTVFEPSTRLLAVDGMKPDGFVVGIELLNDNTTPMDFVVDMLERHAVVERAAAIALMLDVHRRGGLLLPQPTLAVAQVVAEAITREARARGHALVCRAVTAAD